ncbi:unnamed protein product [Pedinophyceae sp. YPF-701]|nr:unnamed protein product [Pedinophyceae sp. YPF-701]
MMSVDDLPDGDVCDDFVCNSSPAVAQTVRQLARDLSRRFEVAQSSVADKVTYKDPLRSFEGRAGYEQNYIATNVTNPQGTVTRMQMEGNKTAVISWTLRGAINGQDVEIDMRDEFDLNLISGRVEAHRCAWDLSRCSATGKLAFQATRAIWSVSAALATKEKQDEMKNDDAMSSMDLNSSGMPSDPTKFFQGQQNNNDQEFQDAVTFAGALAVLWLLAKALEEVSKIGG